MSPIVQGDGSYIVIAAAHIDADGSPRAYGPNNTGLDFTANAGHSGDWWGVVTEEDGSPVIQCDKDPHPGMYVSTTSLVRRGFGNNDPARYVDSEKVPYIVVPGIWARSVKEIVLGCRGTVTNTANNATCEVVVADIGPDFGELSMAAARILGLNPDPRKGGCDLHTFRYQIWPGQAAQGFELQRL